MKGKYGRVSSIGNPSMTLSNSPAYTMGRAERTIDLNANPFQALPKSTGNLCDLYLSKCSSSSSNNTNSKSITKLNTIKNQKQKPKNLFFFSTNYIYFSFWFNFSF